MTKRKSISAERKNTELELQSYFDHHAHGATYSESVKPDRTQLKLAHELETFESRVMASNRFK